MTKLHTQTFKLSYIVGEIYTLRYLHWKRRKTNKYVSYPKITIKPFLKKDTESNNKNKNIHEKDSTADVSKQKREQCI